MSETSAPPNAHPALVPQTNRAHAWAGLLGGLLGGTLAGGLGSIIGLSILDMAPPQRGTLLPNLRDGILIGGLAAGTMGTLAGLLIGRWYGQRRAFVWTGLAAFWSMLVSAVEVIQDQDMASGAYTFLAGMVLLLALCAMGRWLGRGLWRMRWLLLAWLGLCMVGEVYTRMRPPSFIDPLSKPSEPVVQLGYSPLPSGLGGIAVHYHFLTFDPAEAAIADASLVGLLGSPVQAPLLAATTLVPGRARESRWHRWDLWQYANHGGQSWGHVHRDLLTASAGVGGGPPRIEREWRGEQARAILRALERSPDYPYRESYLAWPGPNSNTYPAWVLRQAGVSADMDPRAIGRDYHGRYGVGPTTTGTGVQAESPLLGVKLGLKDGAEMHFLCFTMGVNVWPPATKTPFGRFGFSE